MSAMIVFFVLKELLQILTQDSFLKSKGIFFVNILSSRNSANWLLGVFVNKRSVLLCLIDSLNIHTFDKHLILHLCAECVSCHLLVTLMFPLLQYHSVHVIFQ